MGPPPAPRTPIQISEVRSSSEEEVVAQHNCMHNRGKGRRKKGNINQRECALGCVLRTLSDIVDVTACALHYYPPPLEMSIIAPLVRKTCSSFAAAAASSPHLLFNQRRRRRRVVQLPFHCCCCCCCYYNIISVVHQTLVVSTTMAGSGEDISSVPGNTEVVSVDSTISQIDGKPVVVVDFNNSSNDEDLVKYGFERPEMRSSSLAGTVDPYDRHIFLCYKSPASWPSHLEKAEHEPLPGLLDAALKSRKDDITGKTRLTICEGTDSTNGDILIFPEMIKYKGLTESEVDTFVEDVLVKANIEGSAKELPGSYVFVCAHASRDRRCGVCGPVLIEKFKEEIGLRRLKDQIFVSPCSHVGGHKYAGNVIIFCPNYDGKVTGHWYGYVTPDDVPTLLDQHIGKGEIVKDLWRGEMSSSVQEEKKVEEPKALENGGIADSNGSNLEKVDKEPREVKDGVGCCQGANGVSCCRDEKVEVINEVAGKTTEVKTKGLEKLSAWMGKWEQGDVLTATAVVGAVAAVAVAYSFYRRSS